MIFSCNRFALFPRMCSECKRYIWMEPYRRSDVWHGGFVDRYFKGDYKKENIGLNPSDRLYVSCPKCGAFMTYDGELEECFCSVCDFQGRVDTRLGIVRIDEKE